MVIQWKKSVFRFIRTQDDMCHILHCTFKIRLEIPLIKFQHVLLSSQLTVAKGVFAYSGASENQPANPTLSETLRLTAKVRKSLPKHTL